MPKLTIYSKEITSANLLKVQVGTNCPQGGDAGHGGRTVLRLIDFGGTNMRCCIGGHDLVDTTKVEIVLLGDSEHETFISALDFALSVLRKIPGKLSEEQEDLE